MKIEHTEHLKFAMMSGALKNAGDFLIVKRCEELIKYIYPNAELHFYMRNTSLEPYLEEINQMNAMIFCGGPAYIPQLYPQGFPLVADLDYIKIPMFALGLGWFGSSAANKAVYNYQFTDTTIELLKRIESDTKVLGCRDWYSVNVLRNNGIWSGKMTGCPAWYNLEFVNQDQFTSANPYAVKKVCISDPADEGNLEKLLDIVAYVKQLFPKAELKVVFHRGVKADAYTSVQKEQMIQNAVSECIGMGAECVDISYGENGFSIYDDCDLHIGFRVHAHIYNLSRRNISILIEEDGRGTGINKALGLECIAAFDYGIKPNCDGERMIGTLGKIPNKYLLQMVDDYINNLYQTDFLQIKNAYGLMQKYFEIMKKHVESLSEYL